MSLLRRSIPAVAAAALLLTVAAPSRASAQATKADLIADFERMRVNVLAMVDSMPEAGLRTAPTPDVRDFAEQIEHVVIGSVNLIASGVDADRVPLGLDPEVYLNEGPSSSAWWTSGSTGCARC